jgi:hypothetical protein
MGSAYNDNVYQVVDLCCELLALVHNACMAEFRDGGSILAYARVSECASKIQATAEKRRQLLAEIQWENEIDKSAWILNSTRRTSIQVGTLGQL